MQIMLRFSMDGIQVYETSFKFTHTSEKIEIINDCIKISYVYGDEGTGLEPYKGYIYANSDEKKCFEPVLKSWRQQATTGSAAASATAASGYTSADVLQILKTKMGLLFWPRKDLLCIVDVATKGDVSISPFNLIRGGHAIYEKYGYKSDFITELKIAIRQQQVGSFLVLSYLKLELNKFMQFVHLRRGVPVSPINSDNHMPLAELMRRYTMEDEQSYYDYQSSESSADALFGTISQWLVYNIGRYREWTLSHSPTAALAVSDFMAVQLIGGPTAWNFCLDPANPLWRASAERLTLLGFDARPLASEGSSSARRGRRTRRYRKRH